MVSVFVVMRLFCAGIVAAQKPDPAILHGTTAKPPESVPLPAREQQSRHNQHRDTGQSYPDGIHDLRQNPPISEPGREVSGHPPSSDFRLHQISTRQVGETSALHELSRIESVLISEICVKGLCGQPPLADGLPSQKGQPENSPAFQRRGACARPPVPSGRLNGWRMVSAMPAISFRKPRSSLTGLGCLRI